MAEAADLEAAFRRVAATRMQDVPLQNAALEVEAVGFRAHVADRVGVLITPWCINLVVLPAAGTARLGPGERRTRSFPSGAYDFMGGEEAECGPFEFLALYSPPEEFASQPAARAVAAAVVDELFRRPGGMSRRALFAGGESACTR